MMGVYLKGVEIPKDGTHPYWVTIHSDGTVEYNENKGQGWQTSEAVPVPPHGRLIDADAFFDDLLFPGKQFEQGMRELIGDAPTVIPAEEEDKPAKGTNIPTTYDLLYEEGGPDA